jgi:hypothetical protein
MENKMLNLSTRYAVYLAAALLSFALIGCSTPATRGAMTPQGIEVSKHNAYSVHVQTNGGAETSAVSGSNISDADLKAAVEDAVVQSRVFKTIVQSAGGDYELSVRVVSLSKPLFGGTFTVEMETAWSLTKQADHTVMMRKSVKSSGKATMSDSLVGVSRLRMAVESAARDNISQGLKAVAELNL